MKSILALSIVSTGVFLTGCAGTFSPDAVQNADNKACRADLTHALEKILATQNTGKSRAEITEVAQKTIPHALSQMLGRTEGFSIDLTEYKGLFSQTSPNYKQYNFTYKNKGEICHLRLYSRTDGSTQYTNTITFIESEPVPNCTCQATGTAD